MNEKSIDRRDLLKTTLAATASLAVGARLAPGKETDSPFDAKGLPTVTLGKAGVKVPLIGYGTGSRFYAIHDEDLAAELLTYALDHGLYFWDTAHGYGDDKVISEERLGRILKHRRKEIFQTTKVGARDAESAKKEIELSLKRLQTDYIDLLQVHGLGSLADAQRAAQNDGVVKLLHELKEQGVARHIGFTGHSTDEGMAFGAKEYGFDTMLVALNHNTFDVEDGQRQNFENIAMPVAAQKKMGIIAMKVIRPREMIASLKPRDLIRYALTLEPVHAAVIAMNSLADIKENIATLKEFRPLTPDQMKSMHVALTPFYRHHTPEWLRPHYRDSRLA